MLIVAGKLTVDPADVDSLAAAATEMMEATRQEAGCVEYVFSVSVADPGSVQIFEIWESAEALEAHFGQPHMATFRAATAGLAISDRSIHRYEIASSEPL